MLVMLPWILFVLALAGLAWRTERISSAHREIYKLRLEDARKEARIKELEEFRDEINEIRTRNPYETLVWRKNMPDNDKRAIL